MANPVVMNGTVNSIKNLWPKKTSMEILIERIVCTNSRCYACGSLVYAVEKKKTTNHIYHSSCFRCRICKRNLNGSTLNEDGDDIYCTNCYRKKQRGDCSGLEFQRAAKERAQFIYNHQYPDQDPPRINPQRPVLHDLSRHPSWTLRQLERQFLSVEEKKPDTTKKYRQTVSVSHPLTIKTNFSNLINSDDDRRNSTSLFGSLTPTLRFLPVSPFPNTQTNSTPKTPDLIKTEKTISLSNIPSRFFKRFSVDLTNTKSPKNERRYSLSADFNKKTEQTSPMKFYFPERISTSPRRRSSSVSYSISSQKIK